MRIIVDAFGGDNAPLEIIKGAKSAWDDFGVQIILTGRERTIRQCAEKNGISLDFAEIVDTESIVEMTDEPKVILRKKRDSSMGKGLSMLSEGCGDVFISAGNTGALVMGATFTVKRIENIKRASILSVLPSCTKPFLLTDVGANAECRSENLVDFALMANIYSENIMNVKSPSVSLANIGTEPNKGTAVLQKAYKLLSENKRLNFIGNIEARDIPYGKSDIVVSDGFTGNILLKMYEGAASATMESIKDIYRKNTLTKISALMIKKNLSEFKKNTDYTEFGGAAVMGIKKPVIKAHGSSNAKAIYNAIRQGRDFYGNSVCEKIAEEVG